MQCENELGAAGSVATRQRPICIAHCLTPSQEDHKLILIYGLTLSKSLMEVCLRGNNSVLRWFYIVKRTGTPCHMKTAATVSVVAQGVSASAA